MTLSNQSSTTSLGADALANALRENHATLESVLGEYRTRIDQHESTLHVWQYLDWAQVEQRVAELLAKPEEERGVLWGIPIGIKDIFDTHDMPTAYGSPIYKNHRPVADAACLARLRAADAILLGKTVSTEFAFWQAGPTRNPVNVAHTPGGSSSGSAAAVAANFTPLALGSQTAASTIRPAAYCGVIGFKPTYGLISTAGIKPLASSMDTVGMFARSVGDIRLLFNVLTGAQPQTKQVVQQYTFRLFDEGELNSLSALASAHFEQAIRSIKSLGMKVLNAKSENNAEPLHSIQTRLMAYETHRELSTEYLRHKERISPVLNQFIEQGAGYSLTDWHAAIEYRHFIMADPEALFGEADILIMPSACGQAPRIDEGTGDPIMSRAWTYLGLPSITLPLLNQKDELPFGVQLAARPGQDQLLLEVAEFLTTMLRDC